MKPFTCLSLLFTLISYCYSQENLQNSTQKPLVDAKQILQKSAEACEKINIIEYKEEQFELNYPSSVPFLTATIRQERANVPDTGLPGKYIVDGLTVDNANKPKPFNFSYDGVTIRSLDAENKIINVLKSPTPYIAGRVLGETGGGLTGILQYTEDQPFKIFLDTGEKFTYEGIRMINDEECDVVSVTRTIEHPVMGKRVTTSRWFISRRDNLPRGNETGATQRIIKILKINDTTSPADYFIPIKNGYSERLITGKEPRGKGLLAVNTAAPDWTLADPQGKSHSLSEYRGKIVVMDFWGTWCVPCWKSMPGVQELHEKFKDQDVVVFGISVADKEVDPAAFMKQKGYTYNLLVNGDDAATAYQATTLPTLYVIGFDGQIIYAEYGYRNEAKQELTSLIENYLKTQKK